MSTKKEHRLQERSSRHFSRRWIGIVLLLAGLLLMLAAACSRGQGGTDVLAKVNGRKIMRSEVDRYFRRQTQGVPQALSEEEAQSLRLNILHTLIDNEILMQRAEKLGLLATDAELDNKLSEVKAPYTNEEFDRRLKDGDLTLDEFRRELRRSITINKVVDKEISSKISISDADITAYYNRNKAKFNLIEPNYHLAQILVTSQPNPQVRNLKNDKAQNEAEARKKVQMIYNRLQSGEDFAVLASSYSEHPETSANGGDLGLVPESSLKSDRQTFDVISKLRAGQYTQPLVSADPKTHQIQVLIVRLIEKFPAGQRELKDKQLQDWIRTRLREGREQLLRDAYYDSLHNSASIENYLADQIVKSTGGQ
jgi:peptidyl-prolyl cis-trans isomerase SurA